MAGAASRFVPDDVSPSAVARYNRTMRTALLLLVLFGCAAGAKRPAYDATPTSVVAQRQALNEPVRAVQAESITLSSRSVGGMLAAGPATPPTAQVMRPAEPRSPEQLVIEAWLEMQTEEVTATAAAVRRQVEAGGGRVVSENLIGPPGKASSAAMELRVPPGSANALLDWIGQQGVVESRRVLASDVSKQLFEQELAIQNLTLTMTRLQKIAEGDIPMKDLLELEKEMTRVRGEIERIKGEQRFLVDRVQFATISLTLEREGGPVEFAPHARIHPGLRVAMLSLLDPEGRERTRPGGGVTIHVARYMTLDLDIFPKRDGGESRAVIATVGSALYSSFLGNGHRRFGNPYVGYRLGYGYLSDHSAFAVAGELGIELFKHEYLLVEAAARATAFLRSDNSDVALHAFVGFAVPF